MKLNPSLLFLLPFTASAEMHFNINASSFSYSEIAPVKQVFDDLKGPPIRKGDTAFTFDQVEFSGGKKPLVISAFYRYHYLLEFSPDSADAVYADKNDIELQANEKYDVDISADHVGAYGLSLGYTKKISNWHFHIKGAYLYANQMTDGRLQGYLETNDNNTLKGELNLSYFYSKDIFF